MKKALEIAALGMGIFLIATIDSYSIPVLLIIAAVTWIAYFAYVWQQRQAKAKVIEIQSDEDIIAWLKSTIKKLEDK